MVTGVLRGCGILLVTRNNERGWKCGAGGVAGGGRGWGRRGGWCAISAEGDFGRRGTRNVHPPSPLSAAPAPANPTTHHVQLEVLVPEERFQLGEGPIWDEKGSALLFVDIVGRRALRLGAEGLQTVRLPSMVSTIVPCSGEGRAAVALQDGFFGIDFAEPERAPQRLAADPEADTPRTRFNE
jgi:SMP-30/Gluconolactonase/LRE-like region